MKRVTVLSIVFGCMILFASARQALAAVAKNRAVIVIPWRWRVLWWLYRFCPGLAVALIRREFLANKKVLDEHIPST